MEALPQAVLALSGSGGILFANSAAERLLLEGDGFSTHDDVLVTRHLAHQPLFERMLRNAADKESGGWMPVPRASGRRPYAVFVSPLASDDTQLAGAEAKVLVVVQDPCARVAPNAEMLHFLYGLTAAEARLAGALAAGHSLASASAAYGVGLGTTRTQLKSVFRKTGVNRQQDLVRLLGSTAALDAPALTDAPDPNHAPEG